MQELVREYLNELGKKQKKHRRFRIVTAVFAVMVVAGVIWGLSRAGIATTGEPKCGKEDHQHTDECYSDALNCGQEEGGGHQHTEACWQEESVLICGQEESEEHQHTEECYQPESVLVCGQEESEGHTHGEECYTKQLSCGKEEHQHEEECYIDKSADVEEESQWTAQYEDVEWKETWGEDLVIAAQLQLDYKESIENYTVAEDGSHKGYTRYGQFAGDPYTDWDASFVNFCMYYAGLASSEMFPEEMNTADWYNKFVEADGGNKIVYLTADKDYEPEAGDIVFFEKENEETETQMGIVSSYNKENQELKVIEGNSDNQVKENTYDVNDEHISEYLKITDMEEEYKGLDEEPEEATDGNEGEEGTETDANDAESDGDNEGTGENNKDELTEGNEKTVGEEVNEEVPEEATVELTTEVDGTVITLSGPESSFEKDKNYSIQAEKIEDEETIATIEEAIDKEAEKQEKKVENYQAFDIKLLVDGEEVQPLGPVAVKFSGKEVEESVENEATEVNVIHVDENTGETTDMEAAETDEKEVVIETEHFSVYVYIEFGDMELGGVKINIQHWGEKIQTVDGKSKTMNANTPEYGFDVGTGTVKMKEEAEYQLYTTDTDYALPNETYVDIRSLSKVYNVSDSGYKISRIWVSDDGATAKYGEGAEWEGGFIEYINIAGKDSEELKNLPDGSRLVDLEKEDIDVEIKNLPDGAVIRFWYEPIEGTKRDEVSFYDYTIGEGGLISGKTGADRKGINQDANFTEGEDDKSPRLGIGQKSYGNYSSWVTDTYKGKKLNAGNRVENCDYAFEGLVKNKLVDGRLVFVDDINAPNNLFTNDPENGSRLCTGYELEFLRKGDTYTLANVYKGKDSQTPLSSAKNLTEFSRMNKWVAQGQPAGSNGYVFSNKFWPLDEVEDQVDIQSVGESDFGETHNWYFGMAYEIDFDITGYTGPLEYYFRGDDDFWLFVDGILAVDLGGIHAAMGTSFDLKAFMEENNLLTDGSHKLSVYYMERGATGSTCYMQFTLPRAQVNPLIPQETTSCKVIKDWADYGNKFRPEGIKVTLYKEKQGESPIAVREVTLPYNGKWEYEWNNLPVWDGKNKKAITYSVKEEPLDGNPMLDYSVETDREESTGKITVTLKNILNLNKIKVEKLWKGDENETVNRPQKVTFQLYYKDYENSGGNLVPYLDKDGAPRTVDLTAGSDGKWTGEFINIPKYYYDNQDKVWKEVEYWVKELSDSLITGELNGENGAIYKIGDVEEVELTEQEEEEKYIDSFKLTNTLATKNVCIEKISQSSGTPHLQGAVFNLYKAEAYDADGDKAEVVKTCTTDENGFVDIQGLRFGKYYLVEIQAPIHYAILENPIIIDAAENGVTVDFQIKGWDADSEHVRFDSENGKYIITIPNEIMYELPSTGGPGTYWYMFGGLLLMTTATLITYRKKRRGVLRS